MSVERQHYVPRGFPQAAPLWKGTSDKFVWVYEKAKDRRPRCFIDQVSYLGTQYYEQEDEAGDPRSPTPWFKLLTMEGSTDLVDDGSHSAPVIA